MPTSCSAVGAELGYYTSEGGLLFPSAEVARIDIRAYPEEIGVIPGLYVQGDARKAVTALNRGLEAPAGPQPRISQCRDKAVLTRAAASRSDRRMTGWIRACWRATVRGRCRRARC